MPLLGEFAALVGASEQNIKKDLVIEDLAQSEGSEDVSKIS